jgi:hypothetical protein
MAPQQPTTAEADYSPEIEQGDLGALLDSRVEQAAQSQSTASFIAPPPAADDLSHELVGAARPLRRVERVKYNPGRGGYG